MLKQAASLCRPAGRTFQLGMASAGRVYSVQVGAFRGVPDAEAMAALGTLTREDAGSDGWLRLFSGRFVTQSEAEEHRRELRSQGRADAFIVVYINGRRIPLSQASLTSVASLPGAAKRRGLLKRLNKL